LRGSPSSTRAVGASDRGWIRRRGRHFPISRRLFRDYLRAHPAAAEAYARLKRALAKELADPLTHPDVKDPACDLIWVAAEEWPAATSWSSI
jgi:GrpB-like predicted nucleotidyltransferase (UPF0157 family)